MISRNRNESNKAIKKCKCRCVICGWDKKAPDGSNLVVGAHVLDFAIDKSKDKYTNIIALCPNHHEEFDNNCFYIDPNTYTVVTYDDNDPINGKKVEIEYVSPRSLAYKQYRVTEAWKKYSKELNKKSNISTNNWK